MDKENDLAEVTEADACEFAEARAEEEAADERDDAMEVEAAVEAAFLFAANSGSDVQFTTVP